MAAVLGFGTVFGGKIPEGRVMADNEETKTVVVAQGQGTGADFSEDSWDFAGIQQNPETGAETDVMKAGEGRAPPY